MNYLIRKRVFQDHGQVLVVVGVGVAVAVGSNSLSTRSLLHRLRIIVGPKAPRELNLITTPLPKS